MIGDLDRSKWARKIDWYLNFQLTRAEPHQPVSISSELNQILEEWEVEAPPRIELPHSAPLMVASASLLPNTTTVQVPLNEKTEAWVLSCHRIWTDLGRPSLRVFLPSSVSEAAFEKHWPSADKESGVELVEGDISN